MFDSICPYEHLETDRLLMMSGLTYIIIILILISIFVTCSEVFLRFGILSARVRLRPFCLTLDACSRTETLTPTSSNRDLGLV